MMSLIYLKAVGKSLMMKINAESRRKMALTNTYAAIQKYANGRKGESLAACMEGFSEMQFQELFYITWMTEFLLPVSYVQHLLCDARKLVGIQQHASIPTVLDVHLHSIKRQRVFCFDCFHIIRWRLNQDLVYPESILRELYQLPRDLQDSISVYFITCTTFEARPQEMLTLG